MKTKIKETNRSNKNEKWKSYKFFLIPENDYEKIVLKDLENASCYVDGVIINTFNKKGEPTEIAFDGESKQCIWDILY